MKNILVPTDFSPTALKALEVAARLASSCKATLAVMHAYSLLESEFSENKALREAWNEQQKTEKWTKLLQCKQWVQEQYPDLPVDIQLFTGYEQKAILSFAEDNQTNLIVMGTQGASGLGKVFIGSTTAELITRTTRPILTIPQLYEEKTPQFLLLALNSAKMDYTTLNPAFALAACWNIPVKVMHFLDNDDDNTLKNASRDTLEKMVATLRKQFPWVMQEGLLVHGDSFEETTESYFNENPGGILGMITRKRGFLEKIFNPSLTKQMAYHTRIPLLAMPEK